MAQRTIAYERLLEQLRVYHQNIIPDYMPEKKIVGQAIEELERLHDALVAISNANTGSNMYARRVLWG